MRVSVPLEFYSALISACTICYVIYRINTDLKKVSLVNYIISALFITSVTAFINVLSPEMNMGIKLTLGFLSVLMVVRLFFKINMYYTVISAVFSIVAISFADLLLSLFSTNLLDTTKEQFRVNFFNLTVGGLLNFLFCCIFVRFIAEDFMKARKRIYKRHKRFMILLCGNLVTVFVILIFIYSLFSFTFEIKDALKFNSGAYISIIIVIGVLMGSIAGTIYLINYFLLNRLKYDRLKTTNLKDVMTGTLNRSSGLKFIEEQLELCKNQSKTMTLCYIDVNDLKVINDMLGHREGDFLLKTIIGTIKENIRDTDVISRLGGDEFVIVFPGCTMDYSERVMDRISGELRQLKPFSNKEYTISISYGFSEYNGEAGITVEVLLDKADHQMYQNKRAIKAMA